MQVNAMTAAPINKACRIATSLRVVLDSASVSKARTRIGCRICALMLLKVGRVAAPPRAVRSPMAPRLGFLPGPNLECLLDGFRRPLRRLRLDEACHVSSLPCQRRRPHPAGGGFRGA